MSIQPSGWARRCASASFIRSLPAILAGRLVAALLLTLTCAAPANAHIIELERSQIATGTPLGILLTEDKDGASNFHFFIDLPPNPGPIFAHGVQHYYFGTKITEIFFTDAQHESASIEIMRNLGAILAVRSVNQGFPNEDLMDLLGEDAMINTALAFLVDRYRPVPEPAQWALMITGLALAGAALRRRPARTAAA